MKITVRIAKVLWLLPMINIAAYAEPKTKAQCETEHVASMTICGDVLEACGGETDYQCYEGWEICSGQSTSEYQSCLKEVK
jgi:hypothetical protein